jgi:hypothetical protein
MTLQITISPDAEAALRRQADESGISAETAAARLLELSLSRIPDLIGISGSTYKGFKASGMSEDELSDLLEREKHSMRDERQSKTS